MSTTRVQRAAQRHPRLALPVLAILGVAVLAGCGRPDEVDPETTARLIQPVARVEIAREQIKPGARTGEQIYQTICTGCHAAGLLDAPKTGDAAGWADRLAKGLEANVASVINGLGAMPPRGGGADLTDTEVERAVVYLLNTAGGNFTEPPIE
jgi:cytochrome c5